MNVLYTCDNNYVWLMGISMISLFENNREMQNLVVYLLGENISCANKKVLSSIAGVYERKVIIFDVPKFDIPSCIVSNRWPISAFFRLFAGVLLPKEIEQILYLDCDTIIEGKIDELEKWNMGEKIFFGVKDCIGDNYKRNLGIKFENSYINAGVLLIDLEKLREVDVKQRIENYLFQYKRRITYADQDLLNGLFYGDIGYLPPKYNVMTINVSHTYDEMKCLRRPTNFYSRKELEEAIEDMRIVHYTTNMLVVRPWYKNSSHPLKDGFEKYKSISPWNNRELNEVVFSKETKVIKVICVLPKRVAYTILGFIHSVLKPKYIYFKSRIIDSRDCRRKKGGI